MDDSNGTRPWGDLPQDILVSIHNKSHYVDQVRFRVVCNNWRIPKDFIKRRDNLPWVLTKFSLMKSTSGTTRCPFECEFIDPYSQNIYKVSNYIQDCKDFISLSDHTATVYASKYGWSLLGLTQGHGSLLLLHNPFTNEVITLPHLDLICKAATFTANPTSPECEILVFCRRYTIRGEENYDLYIGRCCLSSKEWSTRFLESQRKDPHSLCCINKELYCLFYNSYALRHDALLKSYNLKEESWKVVVTRLPLYYRCGEISFLADKENDLILISAQLGNSTSMSVFRMDWSTMSWSMEPNLDNVAFFRSGNASLLAILEDGEGEMMPACMKLVDMVAFDQDYNGNGNKCYYFKKARLDWNRQLKDDDSSWIGKSCVGLSFIEPTYARY